MERKPKVLVTYPNFHRYFVPFLPFYEPLVAILLATLVQDISEVKIFDRRYETEKAWIKELKKFRPDLIACRIHTSGEIFTTRRMLEIAKKIDPGVTTIIGGQHPTLLPDDFNYPCFDLVCIGPGEETFVDTVNALKEGRGFDHIKGLAIRKGEKLHFTKERPMRSGTFSWPKLNRNLASKYRRHFKAEIAVTTHGCPYRCKFCSLWLTARGTYKVREPEEIAEDIASLPRPHVYIADDNTFHDYSHAFAIYEALKKRNVNKEYTAYARTDTIVKHPDLFERWKELGLKNLVVGFEAISDEDLLDINKKNLLDNNITAIEILNRLKINNAAHFIIFPHFTKKDFEALWRFIDKYKIPLPFFVPLTPTAGTPLFKEAKEKRLLSTYNYGFYNLEYMIYKTTLPKWQFYLEHTKLWLRSASLITYLRMRRHISFLTYLHRVAIILRAFPFYLRNITEQMIEEKTKKYEDIKETLPPSLRDGYRFRYLPQDEQYE